MTLSELILYLERNHQINRLSVEYYFDRDFSLIEGLAKIVAENPQGPLRINVDPSDPSILCVYFS